MNSDNRIPPHKNGWFWLVSLLSIIIVISVLYWLIFRSGITLNITTLDMLSIIIAFFAIGLSAAFYFKTTDSSNKFYDNTFKFTKELSDLVSRMEAGFGEKLSNIEHYYVNGNTKNPQEEKAALDEAIEQKKDIEDKFNKTIEEFSATKIDQEQLKERLSQYQKDIEKKDQEIQFLNQQIKDKGALIETFAIPTDLRRYIKLFIADRYADDILNLGRVSLAMKLQRLLSELNDEVKHDLMKYHIINSEYFLTSQGYSLLKALAQS